MSVAFSPAALPATERTARVANLDFLRAAAIMGVVAYHLVGMAREPIAILSGITFYGRFGVDMFFVLSGWLIGQLYWQEFALAGTVDIQRFWARRWMRTVPPYLAALLVAWGAAFLARLEPFDWTYLLFVQNYSATLPFFTISWSLCIEEHFYMLTPLLLAALLRVRALLALAWAVAVLGPTLCRALIDVPAPTAPLGYAETATHLHCEGLAIGFGLAYLARSNTGSWSRIVELALPLVIISVVFLVLLQLSTPQVRFVVWPLALALGFGSLLVGLLHAPVILGMALWKPIALASYSVYLTHALAIHAAIQYADASAYMPIALLRMGLFGGAFYLAVERTSIRLRDVWFPREASAHRALLP